MIDFAVFLLIVLTIVSVLWDYKLIQRWWKWFKE